MKRLQTKKEKNNDNKKEIRTFGEAVATA